MHRLYAAVVIIFHLTRVVVVYSYNRKVDAEVNTGDLFWYLFSPPFMLPLAEVPPGNPHYTQYKALQRLQWLTDIMEVVFIALLIYEYWRLKHLLDA